VILVILFIEIHSRIWNGISVVEFNLGEGIGVMFGMTILVTLFELVVVFLKRCLNISNGESCKSQTGNRGLFSQCSPARPVA
jgi:hypothetical protein